MDCNYLNREIKAIVFNRDIIFIFLLYKYSIPSKNILYILVLFERILFFQFQEFPFLNFYSLICLYCPTCANLGSLRKSNCSFEINFDYVSTNSARIIINETELIVHSYAYILEQEIKLSI